MSPSCIAYIGCYWLRYVHFSQAPSNLPLNYIHHLLFISNYCMNYTLSMIFKPYLHVTIYIQSLSYASSHGPNSEWAAGAASASQGGWKGEDPRNHGPNLNLLPATTAGYYPDDVASFAGRRLRFESKPVDQRRTNVNRRQWLTPLDLPTPSLIRASGTD